MSAIFEGARPAVVAQHSARPARVCIAASLTRISHLGGAAGYEKELVDLCSSITRKAALIPTLTRGKWFFEVLPTRACCA